MSRGRYSRRNKTIEREKRSERGGKRVKYSRAEVALTISISPRRRPWKITAPVSQRRGGRRRRRRSEASSSKDLKAKKIRPWLGLAWGLTAFLPRPPLLRLLSLCRVIFVLFCIFLSISSFICSQTLIAYIRSNLLSRWLWRWRWMGHFVVDFVNPFVNPFTIKKI